MHNILTALSECGELQIEQSSDRMDELSQGEAGVVSELLATGATRRRLQDLGLVRGTNVVCLHRSFGGSIAAYRIRGAVIALRSDDAQNVVLE